MNKQNVLKRCCAFSEGKTDVHEEKEGHMCDALLRRSEKAVQTNLPLKTRELQNIIQNVPMTTLHEPNEIWFRQLAVNFYDYGI